MYTLMVYSTNWNDERWICLTSKLLASRVFMVAILVWAYSTVGNGEPSEFPFRMGHAYRAPGPNEVDTFKRFLERQLYGPTPIWYSDIQFPQYPGSKTTSTCRCTFGRYKGWCEVNFNSNDSPAQIEAFYKRWAMGNGYSFPDPTFFVADKPGQRFRLRVSEVRDAASHVFIQHFPVRHAPRPTGY
jgi:hypothetical protein